MTARQKPLFTHAPENWEPGVAEAVAAENGFKLEDDHWILIRCLQEYFDKNEHPKLRSMTDALDERFHEKGGMKYLHQVLPQGPIAMGCKLAGLEPPASAIDESFGTAA